MTDNSQTVSQLMGLKSDLRYEKFIELTLSDGQVWVLRDDEGCLMINAGDEDCIPVWPSSEAAAACAIADWKGFEPLAVAMPDWLEKWLPGMEKDQRVVAVFPNLAGESLVVAAEELLHEMTA